MVKDRVRCERGQVGIGTLIVFIALVLVAAIAAGVLINTAGFLQTQAEATGEDSTDQVADNLNVIGETGEVVQAPLADGSDENFVYQVRLTVQGSPGASDIDLEAVSIQWVGDNGFAQLVHVGDDSLEEVTVDGDDIEDDPNDATDGAGERGDEAFLVEPVTAESEEDAVLTDDSDRYDIVIPIALIHDGTDTALVDERLNAGEGEGASTPSVSEIGDRFNDVIVDDGDINFDNADLALLANDEEATLELTTEVGAVRSVVLVAPDTLVEKEDETVTL